MPGEIFLIEDDIDHAELITTFLKVEGINNEVIWFRDAESAIERLKEIEERGESNPAVIIIDLKLPRMSGFQLISHIRAIDRFVNIPIIVISSSSRAEDALRSIELGAAEFINKLAEMDRLGSKIRRYI